MPYFRVAAIIAQVVVAHLVPQPAGAAVDHDGDLIAPQAESLRHTLVEDLGDVLDLGEVIAGAQRPEPIGKPYPQWMSGMASEAPTIPGRCATFCTWVRLGSSRMSAMSRSSA
jgi:hypothetical protein